MDRELTISGSSALVLGEPLPPDRHPAAVYLAGLASPASRRVQRLALDVIAGALVGEADAALVDWSALRFQHVAAVRAWLLERYAPATVNRMLSALRGAIRAAWRLGQMTAEQYHRAVDVKSVTGETLPAGRELTPGEIAALLGACEQNGGPAGPRDAAMIGLMYGSGLRRAELAALDVADYDAEGGALRVKGKGRRERELYPQNGVRRALRDWLALRGGAPGPLFVDVNKGGAIGTRRLTARSIYDKLKARAAQAGIGDCTPHDLRRSFVSHLLDAGADLAAVADLAGHQSTNTTRRYDRRGERALRSASSLLHVPYTGREEQG